jgi:hypothetical protein
MQLHYWGDVTGAATVINSNFSSGLWEFCKILSGLVNIVGNFRLEFYLEAK